LSPESIRSAVERGTLSRAFNLWEHLNYFNVASLHGALAAHGFVPYRNMIPQNLGFIPHATGLRRLRNMVGVALRAFRYREDLGTSVVCRRGKAPGKR
jgi:hypothetical protein